MQTQIKLGQEVHDVVSGVKGIVVGLATQLHGNLRVLIQLPMHEGKIVDGVWLDHAGLDITDAVAQTSRAVAVIQDGQSLLGLRVRDTITKFEGTVISVITYLNGCVRHEVEPLFNLTREARDNESKIFDHGRLTPVTDVRPVEIAQTRTGGPMTRGKP